jgi:hypothetical protein
MGKNESTTLVIYKWVENENIVVCFLEEGPFTFFMNADGQVDYVNTHTLGVAHQLGLVVRIS